MDQDNLSGQQNDPAATEGRHEGSSSAVRTIVRVGLFLVLILMVLALYQDRMRARPQVEAAYDEIYTLVDRINASAENRATTSHDVQEALGREPSRSWEHGPYVIEVYSWRAGLPWRTHDLYALYSPGRDGKTLYLLSHYKFELPEDELAALTPPPESERQQSGGTPGDPSGMTAGFGPPGGGGGGGGGGGQFGGGPPPQGPPPGWQPPGEAEAAEGAETAESGEATETAEGAEAQATETDSAEPEATDSTEAVETQSTEQPAETEETAPQAADAQP